MKTTSTFRLAAAIVACTRETLTACPPALFACFQVSAAVSYERTLGQLTSLQQEYLETQQVRQSSRAQVVHCSPKLAKHAGPCRPMGRHLTICAASRNPAKARRHGTISSSAKYCLLFGAASWRRSLFGTVVSGQQDPPPLTPLPSLPRATCINGNAPPVPLIRTRTPHPPSPLPADSPTPSTPTYSPHTNNLLQAHLRQLEALCSQLGQARGEAQQLGGQLAAERAGRAADVEALRRQLREAAAEEARAVAELHDACGCWVGWAARPDCEKLGPLGA